MTQEQKELIEEKFKGVHALIQANADIQHEVNENIVKTLKRIEVQTTKTNGRVNSLENWRWKIIGIAIGSSAFIGFIIKVLL